MEMSSTQWAGLCMRLATPIKIESIKININVKKLKLIKMHYASKYIV